MVVYMWEIRFTKAANKDKQLLKQAGLETKAKKILNLMAEDPLMTPPSYEKLIGDLRGYYSRRINIQHRIVYRIYPELKVIVVHAMWTHYEK